jgi:hypothetical protein
MRKSCDFSTVTIVDGLLLNFENPQIYELDTTNP